MYRGTRSLFSRLLAVNRSRSASSMIQADFLLELAGIGHLPITSPGCDGVYERGLKRNGLVTRLNVHRCQRESVASRI